jgi:hypothetical protein
LNFKSTILMLQVTNLKLVVILITARYSYVEIDIKYSEIDLMIATTEYTVWNFDLPTKWLKFHCVSIFFISVNEVNTDFEISKFYYRFSGRIRQAQLTPHLFYCILGLIVCSLSGSQFDSSNQNTLLLFNVCKSNFLSNKKISSMTKLGIRTFY